MLHPRPYLQECAAYALWTVHPRYLVAKGLTAAWREALLAQKVLAGATRGYRQHPQLIRFRSHPAPIQAVGEFLTGLAVEAERRGYCFDVNRILEPEILALIQKQKGSYYMDGLT